MAEFYDNPHSSKMHFRAPAGGGNSVYDGVATAEDIKKHPRQHELYRGEKLQAQARADAEKADADAVAALKIENETMKQQIAEIEAHHDNKEA
jgi:hypothetical protein